jgi:hypothetical protein
MATSRASSTISYLLDPLKYYHPSPSFMHSDMSSGNAVSLYAGNMVNLESDLMGRTRANTKCCAGKYLPGTVIQGVDINRRPKMVHLGGGISSPLNPLANEAKYTGPALPFNPLPKINTQESWTNQFGGPAGGPVLLLNPLSKPYK